MVQKPPKGGHRGTSPGDIANLGDGMGKIILGKHFECKTGWTERIHNTTRIKR